MSKSAKIARVIRKTIIRLVKTKRRNYSIQEFTMIMNETDNISDESFLSLADSYVGASSRLRNRLTCDFMIEHIPSMGASCVGCEAKKGCEARVETL
jgi:hypothetical protein